MKRKELGAMSDAEVRHLLLMAGDEYRRRLKGQLAEYSNTGDREHAGYTLAAHDKLVGTLETILCYC